MLAKVPIVVGVVVAIGLAGCSTFEQQDEQPSADAFAQDSNGGRVPCDTDAAVPDAKIGDVLAFNKLEKPDWTSKNGQELLTSADAYRVRYVSTVANTNDLRSVCGTVVLPTTAAAKFNSDPRLVSWSHGTVGLPDSCQPSQHPASGVFGAMPDGIGSLVGDLPKLPWQRQRPKTGALQTLVNDGKVVTVSDYYNGLGTNPDIQPYMVTRVAAANSIDLITAARELIIKLKTQTVTNLQTDKPVKTVLWGHSQGGATAMVAGQLWQAGYQPRVDNQGKPTATLAGIAMAAPASNLVGKGQGASKEIGLGDSVLRTFVNPLGQLIPDDPEGNQAIQSAIDKDPNDEITLELMRVIPIGPILFTQISQGWEKIAKYEPRDQQPMPAFDPNAWKLPQTVLSDEGTQAAGTLKTLCVGDPDSLAATIGALLPFYRHTVMNPKGKSAVFFKQPFAGKKDSPGVQRTCDKRGDYPDFTNWCKWLSWNTDGPAGENPYNAIPILDPVSGKYVPIYIAQGTNDQIVTCQGAKGQVPAQTEPCMARALYTDLAQKFCPTGGTKSPTGSSVTMNYVNRIGHLGVMAAASSTQAKQTDFAGSPFATFVDQAFAGNAPTGCNIKGPGVVGEIAPPDLNMAGSPLVPYPKQYKEAKATEPIVTWPVAAHADDAEVKVKLKGIQDPKSVLYAKGELDLQALFGAAALKKGLVNFSLDFGGSSKAGYAYRIVKAERAAAALGEPSVLENGSVYVSLVGPTFNYRSGTVTFNPDSTVVVSGTIDAEGTGILTIKPKKGKGAERVWWSMPGGKSYPVLAKFTNNLKIDRAAGLITWGKDPTKTFPAQVGAKLMFH